MKFNIKTLSMLAGLVTAASCGKKDHVFEILPASETGITFNNEIEETDQLNPLDFIYIYNGAGVGVLDINNDGLQDLFFAGNLVQSKLYLNKGDLKFDDITESAGLTNDKWATGGV